jgi:hypothetical protein
MLKEEEMISEHPQWGVAERRTFMLLSLEERRRILTLQADELLSHYREGENRRHRQEWQGGDVVEP